VLVVDGRKEATRARDPEGRDSEYHSNFQPLPLQPHEPRKGYGHDIDHLNLTLLDSSFNSREEIEDFYQSELSKNFKAPELGAADAQRSSPVAGVSTGDHGHVPTNFAWPAAPAKAPETKPEPVTRQAVVNDGRSSEYRSQFVPLPLNPPVRIRDTQGVLSSCSVQ
jgi:hypothetical protein